MIRVRTEGRVTVITIDRESARNAVDPETATALYRAVLDFDADEAADVAVLTGAGGSFCAGFDLKAAAGGLDDAWRARHAIPEGWADPVAEPLPSPMGPARLMPGKPVIAAIEGAAVAGGMELAMWCDLRIMAEGAFMGVFCRRWGVPLIDGGTFRLPRLVGDGRARDLILSGRRLEAEEAREIGLADRLVGRGRALDAALEYASDLLRFPQPCLRADLIAARPAPAALAAALRREWRGAQDLLDAASKGAGRFADGHGRGGDFGDI